MLTKICKTCGEKLPICDFKTSSHVCRHCLNANSRERRAKNPLNKWTKNNLNANFRFGDPGHKI